jgi:hypothetical protein
MAKHYERLADELAYLNPRHTVEETRKLLLNRAAELRAAFRTKAQ